jgi:hypothetical protein
MLTASASVILMTDVTRRQLLMCCHLIRGNGNRENAPKSIVDHRERELNVLREAVDTDSFDDSIYLMSPPGTLALLVVVHDAVLYLRVFLFMIVKATKK